MTSDLPVVVLGAGGHARVVLAVLAELGRPVKGCVAPEPPAMAWPQAQAPYLGDDSVLDALDPESVRLVNGIGSVHSTVLRRSVFERARTLGLCFETVVHPSAIVASGVCLGEGAQVMAGAVVQCGVSIGENAIVNTGAVIEHDCRLGGHCHVAPGVTLCGGVAVGEGAHVGAGATVIQNVVVGAGALVAAGAVVLDDVPNGAAVSGVPARPLER